MGINWVDVRVEAIKMINKRIAMKGYDEKLLLSDVLRLFGCSLPTAKRWIEETKLLNSQ